MRETIPEWVTLSEDEEIIWYGGPSVSRLLQDLTGAFVLTLAGLVLVVAAPSSVFGVELADVPFLPRAITLVGLAILIVGVAIGMLVYLRYSAVGYVVTSEELYVKRGLVSREVTTVRLERIQDTGFTQSTLERVLGYGDVTVSTAGSGGVELRFEDVDDPAEVNNLISRQVDDARSRSDDRARRGDRGDRDDRNRRDDQYGRDDRRAGGAGPDDRPVRDDRGDRDDRPRRDDRGSGEY